MQWTSNYRKVIIILCHNVLVMGITLGAPIQPDPNSDGMICFTLVYFVFFSLSLQILSYWNHHFFRFQSKSMSHLKNILSYIRDIRDGKHLLTNGFKMSMIHYISIYILLLFLFFSYLFHFSIFNFHFTWYDFNHWLKNAVHSFGFILDLFLIFYYHLGTMSL